MRAACGSCSYHRRCFGWQRQVAPGKDRWLRRRLRDPASRHFWTWDRYSRDDSRYPGALDAMLEQRVSAELRGSFPEGRRLIARVWPISGLPVIMFDCQAYSAATAAAVGRQCNRISRDQRRLKVTRDRRYSMERLANARRPYSSSTRRERSSRVRTWVCVSARFQVMPPQ